jgi:putative DNA primase/helicase
MTKGDANSPGHRQPLLNTTRFTQKPSGGGAPQGGPPSPPPNGGAVSGFEMRPDGLYRLAQGKERPELRVCSPFRIIALTRDERNSSWGVLLRWQDSEGLEHEWAMPRALLAGDGKEVRARLLNEGLSIEPHRHAREALMQYLGEAKPDALVRCVTRIGWHPGADGTTVFVLPDAVFSSHSGESVMLQSASELVHAFRVAGTVEQWRAEIASRAIANSRLAFAISAAFGAALLDLASEPSGGVNLQGKSRGGKSTALRVAGSVWGGGGVKGYVEQWRATSNALEGVAAMHCDVLLCLDEMGQVDGREAGEIAYSLANEAGKARATREGGQRSTQSWRTLFLSTGEVSLVEKMQEAGQRARAGQEVRLVDVPADAGAGLGLFEELHGFETADAFARGLTDATRRFYGSPGRSFLAWLVKWCAEVGRDQAARYVSDHQREIIERCVPAGASGQVLSVARRFGLIAAGGELATRAKVTGWPDGEAVRAADQCFRAWLERRGTPGALEDATAIRQVGKFLAQHAASRFAEPWVDDKARKARVIVNRAGFKREVGQDAVEFLILPDVWADEVCAGIDARAAAATLRAHGFLLPGESGKNQASVRVPGEAKRMRVYRVSGTILEDQDAGAPETTDGGGQGGML